PAPSFEDWLLGLDLSRPRRANSALFGRPVYLDRVWTTSGFKSASGRFTSRDKYGDTWRASQRGQSSSGQASYTSSHWCPQFGQMYRLMYKAETSFSAIETPIVRPKRKPSSSRQNA